MVVPDIGYIHPLHRMRDKRVNFLLIFLPVGALVYLILPIHPIPEISILLIRYLAGAFLFYIGWTLLVSLSPDEFVHQHMNGLQKGVPGNWWEAPQQEETGDVFDAEAKRTGEHGK